MNEADFVELKKSIKQAGKIRRREVGASRRCELRPLDIKAIRKRLALSQAEFALMIGGSKATLLGAGTSNS